MGWVAQQPARASGSRSRSQNPARTHARTHAPTTARRPCAGSQCAGLFDPVNKVCVELPPFALRSGPRRTIYHDPRKVTAAIVTCGGLCPGLNDVVQNIVYTLVRGRVGG